MVQNINKITTNAGSVILWNNDSIIASIPKGMYYCHMIDGIVKIKQIGVENIFNIVITSPIDGETFPLVEDMLERLSSFSRGGGNGEGVTEWDDIEDKPTTFPPTIGTTATTAKAGNYQPTWSQVTGKPTTFAPSAHTHAWADITDKPTLFSGSYNDLTNKPTIPTVGNGTITITQGGVSKGSFTTNQTGNTTVEIDAGGGGGSDLMINTTHADLLALVNNNGLTPGQQYRITDYVATVDTDLYNSDNGPFDARSNNHTFDIIVTADSVNQLNENARAIRHEGDTYFPSHTKFEVWKLKYTIFNDSDRFNWAVSGGKGVVYQLIDEWNNRLPYDFKSIQFQRDGVWVYTFGGATDDSLEIGNCYNNTINAMFDGGEYYLNGNTFGIYCRLNTFGHGCAMNTFGDICSSNTFGNDCSLNKFGNNCYLNTFGDSCTSNTFGDSCTSNTLGDSCGQNTFGNYCESISFGNGCLENTFGNSCYKNTFGNGCYGNTFGDFCYLNTFGESCEMNTFGESCKSNTLGHECRQNILGVDYRNYNISNSVTTINFTNQITNFTTTPNGNVVNVIKTLNGVTFSQVISATTTESFDVV